MTNIKLTFTAFSAFVTEQGAGVCLYNLKGDGVHVDSVVIVGHPVHVGLVYKFSSSVTEEDFLELAALSTHHKVDDIYLVKVQ